MILFCLFYSKLQTTNNLNFNLNMYPSLFFNIKSNKIEKSVDNCKIELKQLHNILCFDNVEQNVEVLTKQLNSLNIINTYSYFAEVGKNDSQNIHCFENNIYNMFMNYCVVWNDCNKLYNEYNDILSNLANNLTSQTTNLSIKSPIGENLNLIHKKHLLFEGHDNKLNDIHFNLSVKQLMLEDFGYSIVYDYDNSNDDNTLLIKNGQVVLSYCFIFNVNLGMIYNIDIDQTIDLIENNDSNIVNSLVDTLMNQRIRTIYDCNQMPSSCDWMLRKMFIHMMFHSNNYCFRNDIGCIIDDSNGDFTSRIIKAGIDNVPNVKFNYEIIIKPNIVNQVYKITALSNLTNKDCVLTFKQQEDFMKNENVKYIIMQSRSAEEIFEVCKKASELEKRGTNVELYVMYAFYKTNSEENSKEDSKEGYAAMKKCNLTSLEISDIYNNSEEKIAYKLLYANSNFIQAKNYL